MTALRTLLFPLLLLSLAPSSALAQDAPAPSEPTELRVGAWEDYPRNAAFEVNVLWPFFPGGMVDLKLLVPVLLPNEGNWRGELILGLHSDFGWRVVRESDAGNVALLAANIGWRQFFAYGLHVDVTVHLGWRHQENNPWDGQAIHSFQGRLWTWAGYQHELTRQVYANLRAGLGVHLWRTDRFADQEKQLAFGGDLNIGFRFE